MRLLLVITVLALAGCSNLSPAGNAVVGAAVGVAVMEHANQQRHPPGYSSHPIYCYSRPVRWDPYTGRPVLYKQECR